MSAAEDVAPPTSRSGDVQLKSKEDMAAWQPITARVPVFRVAQWLQQVEAGKLDMGPGATAIHGLLMVMIAQHQGYNAMCEATARALGKAALTSESAARDALAELVKAAWLIRHDRKRSDNQWVEALYSVATEPGHPIPARAPKKRSSVPSSGTHVPANEEPVPSTSTPMVAGGTDIDTDGVPPGVEPCTATQNALYRQAGSPVPPEPNKKTIQETREKITEKTIAGVSAGARTCEATTMPSPSPQANLFGEPVCEPVPPPKPKGAKAPKAPKLAPAPKAADLYSAAYVAGMAAAEPGCGFTPLGEADCRLIGMAAAAHAKDPTTGEPITGEPLLAWIQKTAAEYRRAADPAYAKGFDAHSFLTWLNAGRPKTRKVPLPSPPEPPRPPIVVPPPRPIPEVFLACARADAAKGMVHPLIQRLERMRKPEGT